MLESKPVSVENAVPQKSVEGGWNTHDSLLVKRSRLLLSKKTYPFQMKKKLC